MIGIGIWIGHWDWGLGFENLYRGLGLEIGIWDWELEQGIEIQEWD